MADVAMVMCFKSLSCTEGLSRSWPSLSEKKSFFAYLVSRHLQCIRLLSSTVYVGPCLVGSESMFLTECEAVVYVQQLISTFTDETESSHLLGLMIIILWGESCDIHTGFQCQDGEWLFKKKSLVGMIFIFLLYYLMFFFISMHYCSFN